MRLSSEPGRIFVPLAVTGCGVGCRYCYIDSPSADAVALPVDELRSVLDGLDGTVDSAPLLAISCDTEPAVSADVLRNALLCLEFARERRLAVQLATKFPLPDELRRRLESWPAGEPRPVVFTTITTVALSDRLEPNAPGPEERAANFAAHRGPWLSYALVKPFLATTARDADALLDLMVRHRPDGVVVGVRYRRHAAPPEATSGPGAHPVAPGWVATAPSEAARRFLDALAARNFRVFASTRCVSAWHNASAHGQLIKRQSPHLCVGCGACP